MRSSDLSRLFRILGKEKRKKEQHSLVISYFESQGVLAPVAEFRFAPPRRWHFDFAWENERIALEVEGGVWIKGRHTRPQGFLNDMEKYNNAAALGWRLLRTTPDDLFTIDFLTILRKTFDYGSHQ